MNSDDSVATVLIAACLVSFLLLLVTALMEALP
jgi:hypothetical protein